MRSGAEVYARPRLQCPQLVSAEARSIIESAEQAATAGNYASAEDLLRHAAALQERTLGPNHPDLANTFNNLGIVCEMTDNPIDAEHFFRRAHAIAAATLAPDHPFVATSRKNLHDFCSARGRPVELGPSPPAVAAWLDTPAPARHESPPSAKTPDVPPPPRKNFLPLALGAVGGVGLLIVMVTMAPWGIEETTMQRATTAEPAPEATAPAPETPAPKPSPPPAQPIAPIAPIAQPQPTATTPTVATAQLCTALTVWRCEAASSQVAPGQLFFYTQIKSATDTTIEHRWYQGDRVRRAVQLRIQANPGAGYRTYSRSTITRENDGDWRVELRSADGAVLHEERFTVR
jgi:hypothetical protein